MSNLPAKAPNEIRLPSLEEIVNEKGYEETALTVLLNQPPPEKWIKHHPTATIKDLNGNKIPLPYLPIDRVEYLLTKIYGGYQTEIKQAFTHANSEVVIVRLHVVNPVTGRPEFQDGIGAAPIQTDQGKGAMDWNFAKANGVQLAAPAAESYAIKDAAEKFGKIFGRDITRLTAMGYDALLKEKVEYDWEMLKELFELKKEAYPIEDLPYAERIIKDQEKTSYTKLLNQLQKL